MTADSVLKEQKRRLSAGGRLERNRPLNFSFNGKRYTGFEGDTLASALLANGVRTVGRSFKFHRPRGILSAGVEEPNAILRVGRAAFEDPNVRATLQPLYEGLQARSQNCWPSVNHDLGACFDRVAGLLPAGFYNKTFMWPHWHTWEGIIRRTAGLGTLPGEEDPDDYVHANAHCDVLVCGAGPSGLAAALAAAEGGARVVLVDEQAEPGGSLLWFPATIEDRPGDIWLADTVAALAANERVTLLTRATVTGYFDHDVVLVSQRLSDRHRPSDGPREQLWKLRAQEVVLATGSIEQPLLFPNNDRPGVMLASAVSHYLNRYAVAAGNNVVVATNNDSAYRTALDLSDSGINVVAVVDSRAGSRSEVADEVAVRGVKVMRNCVLTDAKGKKGVSGVGVGWLDSQVPSGFHRELELACDCVAMSGGWQPTVHLFSQARGNLRYDAEQGLFRPGRMLSRVRVVGAANGTVNLNAVLKEGFAAGVSAARADPDKMGKPPSCRGNSVEGWHTERVLLRHRAHRQWIDFQHDVTLRDIELAVRENYRSVEHLKRYTTAGMSVDQGKTSNINALHALAELTGRDVQAVGTTTFRPFYTPVTLGAIAGHRRGDFYSPILRSPLHALHKAAGATFWDYGHWKRPAVFPKRLESLEQAMQREARAVRRSVGIYDGSPLGKIEVTGTDAAEFLNRLYINNMLTLKPGRARYGIMLNENGVVIDDGIVARLDENRFLVHTTSGNADRIFEWMDEWHQCEWPALALTLTRVTTQWANIAVSGPRARSLIDRLELPIELDNDRFPHMSIQEVECWGVVMRIMRASFTGELGYEINVPAGYGSVLWQNLLEVGKAFDVTPYGVESLMLLRTEKGYLHIGADTDGNTTPADIGWGAVVSNKTADFIGKRSLSRLYNVREDRLQLVGLQASSDHAVVTAGAHVIDGTGPCDAAVSRGFVTSAFYSPHLARHIALGLVQNGSARIGDEVKLVHQDEIQCATIVKPVFFDEKGERLRA